MLGITVLGPVTAELDGAALNLGGPRQRAVLALLSTARGTALSAQRIISALWDDAPPSSAAAALQAYVSNLRRVVEPDRRQREAGKVIVSTESGYALRLPDEAVDAWRFEAAVRGAREAGPAQAARLLADALGLWRGPAYAEFADERWARAEAARLEELRCQAGEAQAEAMLGAGRAVSAVVLTEVLTREQPLREEGWRLLALALWATGRQAEALDALRRGSRLLREALGPLPSPVLADLESAVLDGRTDVLWRAVPADGDGLMPISRTEDDAAPKPSPPLPSPSPSQAPDLSARDASPGASTPFVGRREELDAIAAAAQETRHGGGLVLVTGEAGVGKSRILARAGEQLAAQGWNIVVGRCPQFEGAPPAWAWATALRTLAELLPPTRPEAVAALLEDSGRTTAPAPNAAAARFLLHRAVGEWITAAAGVAPLALFLDDLHRADRETLALLEHVAQLGAPGLLIVAAHRPDELEDTLADALAVLARRRPRRLALAGLSGPEVSALIATVHDRPVDRVVVAAIAERTGGNPFYVMECARLLRTEGALATMSEVPQGVRDVLRRRISRLSADAVSILRLAAVAGAESAVPVLLHAAELPAGAAIDALEAAVVAGLLVEPAPDRVAFAHALTRDAVYADLTRVRRGRLHGRIADALLTLDPENLTGLSYHCSEAATAALAPRAFASSLSAADLAERRHSHDAAAGFLERAIAAAERIPDPQRPTDQPATLVELHRRLQRAQIRSGDVTAARETRQRAIAVAEQAGRDDLSAEALSGWHVPTPWQTRPYATVDEPVVRALDRLLATDELDPVVRCRLLDTLVAELSGHDMDRATRAAREELELARRSGDPRLLAMALESSAKSRSHELHADERAALSAQLRGLAESEDMPQYLWVCEFIDACVAAVRNDPAAVRRHAEAGLAVASAYRLHEPEAAHRATLAMLAQTAGRHDEAEERFADVIERMTRRRMLHAQGFAEIAGILLNLDRGEYGRAEPTARARYARLGPPAGDMLALVLARRGHRDEALSIRRPATPRPDKLFAVHATLRAELVVELRLRDQAPNAIRRLLPFADQVAGASTGVHAVHPVARTLGALHLLLNDEEAAARRFAQAEAVARPWSADHWIDDARSSAPAERRRIRAS